MNKNIWVKRCNVPLYLTIASPPQMEHCVYIFLPYENIFTIAMKKKHVSYSYTAWFILFNFKCVATITHQPRNLQSFAK